MTNYEPRWGLGWVDFSADDKSKVMQVLSMLGEPGTVDELGIGVVRDSLSDRMFNGITTIQTRAKYFFIVSNILVSCEKERSSTQAAKDYLHMEETRIMNQLSSHYNYSEKEKIIGVTIAPQNENLKPHRWKQVVRKPSEIYWNGLRQFGLIETDQSLANFLSIIEDASAHAKDAYSGGDDSKDDEDLDNELLNVIKLPTYSKNWDNDLKIELNEQEADFLRHQILDTQKGSLLALILLDLDNTEKFLRCDTFEQATELDFIRSDETVSRVVRTARDFSFLMEGAHIRYNIQLQGIYGSQEGQSKFESEWQEWLKLLAVFNWENFDRAFMWDVANEHGNVKSWSRRFIDDWFNGLQNNISVRLLDELVKKQEGKNKGRRAKLRLNNETRYSNWVGIRTLSYRFGNVHTIVKDIHDGLKLSNA